MADTSAPRTYWTPDPDAAPQTPQMACPRMCGGMLLGAPDGPLVRWACTKCDYVIHS